MTKYILQANIHWAFTFFGEESSHGTNWKWNERKKMGNLRATLIERQISFVWKMFFLFRHQNMSIKIVEDKNAHVRQWMRSVAMIEQRSHKNYDCDVSWWAEIKSYVSFSVAPKRYPVNCYCENSVSINCPLAIGSRGSHTWLNLFPGDRSL